MTKLYHKDVGFPDWFQKPEGNVRLKHTRHSIEQCFIDRTGSIKPFNTLNLRHCTVIEIETDQQFIVKYVLRMELDDERDVIYTVIPGNFWIVKTVWANMKDDLHSTLNRDRYQTV